uniref:Secreted protein n=1 Tax=Populus trichocarpa TaxID=3694 RepID=U5FK55_POPTR
MGFCLNLRRSCLQLSFPSFFLLMTAFVDYEHHCIKMLTLCAACSACCLQFDRIGKHYGACLCSVLH